MDDADLKRVAAAARDAEADYGHCGEGLAEGKDRQSAHMDALKEFIATFSPPTVLSLLARLSAAEARVETLTGLLERTQGHIKAPCQGQYEWDLLNDRLYRDIAQALTKEPTP